MLGYVNASATIRRVHLATKLYPRLKFFMLISLCRVRNNRHFTFLGAITAASSYGVGHTDNARLILKFFGISVGRSTLSRQMKRLSHLPSFYKRMSIRFRHNGFHGWIWMGCNIKIGYTF